MLIALPLLEPQLGGSHGFVYPPSSLTNPTAGFASFAGPTGWPAPPTLLLANWVVENLCGAVRVLAIV